MNLPPQTADIFEYLNKGLFLSRNSQNPNLAQLYAVTDRHVDTLVDYFAPLRYQLEQGDGYFYFSNNLPRPLLEDKLEKASRYLAWVEFCLSWREDFGVGLSFEVEALIQACESNRSLRKKLQHLSSRSSDPVAEQVRGLLRTLEKESWLEEISKKPERYLVLSAYRYVEELLYRIQIRPR